MHAPATLSFYVDIPKDAQLSFRVGQAAGVGREGQGARHSPRAGRAQQLFEQALGADWHEQVISLAPFAGQVVRIDLVAEGAGRGRLEQPRDRGARTASSPKAEPAKNVIVVLIDTLRARPACARTTHRAAACKTPVLDTFAQRGHACSSTRSRPRTGPSPRSPRCFTGLYPATHGTKQSESKLPDEALTRQRGLQEGRASPPPRFIANGYVSDKFGFKQGWDHYTNYIRENKSTTAENVFKEAGDWIEQHKDKRFFVYIQTIDPHVPYDPPDEFLKMYDAARVHGPGLAAQDARPAREGQAQPAERHVQRARRAAPRGALRRRGQLPRPLPRPVHRAAEAARPLRPDTCSSSPPTTARSSTTTARTATATPSTRSCCTSRSSFRRPGVVPPGQAHRGDGQHARHRADGARRRRRPEVPEVMEGIDRNEHMRGSRAGAARGGVQRLPRRPARDPRGPLQADPERHQRDVLRPRDRPGREEGARHAHLADRAALLPHPARPVPGRARPRRLAVGRAPGTSAAASGRRRSRSTTRPPRG